MLTIQSANTMARPIRDTGHDGAERLALDAVVDAVPHQRRERQAGQRVEAVQDQTHQHGDGERPQQPAQREVPVPGPRLGLVHVRQIAGRRQRVDLGEQLRGGRQAAHHAVESVTAARHVPVPGAAPAGRCAGLVPQFGGHLAVRRGRRGGVVLVVGQLAGVDALHVVARPGQQQPVERAALGQLLVGADVGHPAVVEHRDPVGQVQGGAAVRDEQRGPAAHDPVQGGVDLRLQPGVDR